MYSVQRAYIRRYAIFSFDAIQTDESIGLFACLMFFPCHTIVAVVDEVPFPSTAHPLSKAPVSELP